MEKSPNTHFSLNLIIVIIVSVCHLKGRGISILHFLVYEKGKILYVLEFWKKEKEISQFPSNNLLDLCAGIFQNKIKPSLMCEQVITVLQIICLDGNYIIRYLVLRMLEEIFKARLALSNECKNNYCLAN